MDLSNDWQDKLNQLEIKDNASLQEALSLVLCIAPQALQNRQSLVMMISKLIAQIDQQLSTQLDHLIHHADFQSLEKNWASLKTLSSLPINYKRTKLKLLDLSWHELSSDLNQAYTTTSSELFNKIGNKELNTLGGQPFGCIAFAHAISMEINLDAEYDDLFTLELLGKLGEKTLCPMLLSPATDFFANSGGRWISDIGRVGKVLASADYNAWQALRNKDCARFIGLVMPQIQLRKAYQNLKAGFIYNESGKGLWGNAVFPFATTIMREYQRVNWFGFLKSRWNDKYQGALINLPADRQTTSALEEPEVDIKLFGKLSSFYAQNGFIPLTQSPLTNKYYFNGNNSIWNHGSAEDDKVLTQIQTSLMSCRIAHYLKVQVREMIGSFNTAAECELYLTHWVEKFSSNVAFANEETLAKYPLNFAKVSVSESTGQQGSFSCVLRIIPQYQYDYFNGEIVLTTDLENVA